MAANFVCVRVSRRGKSAFGRAFSGRIRPCTLAGCPPGGVVLDPFCGSGTTLKVARELGCRAVGIELNPEYVAIAEGRTAQEVLGFT